MEDYNKPNPRKINTARQRQAGRYRRRDAFVSLKEKVEEGTSYLPDMPVMPRATGALSAFQKARLMFQDALWYLMNRTPVLKIGGAIIGLTLLFLFAGLFLSPNIPPNIWALDMPLGGYSTTEAEASLMDTWQNKTRISITLNGSPFDEVAPEQLGMALDVKQMLDNARAARLSGLPFGVNIEPIVTLDYGAAQTYLLSIVDRVYIAPHEAGYRLEGDTLVGVPGSASLELDVASTLERLRQSPESVLENRHLALLTMTTQPAVADPSPYLSQAQAFLNGGFKLIGYDPFENEFIPWSTTPGEMAKWLSTGVNSLTVNEDGIKPFIAALNERLKTGTAPRYLDPREVAAAIGDALANGTTQATLRVRYMPLIYEIEGGDNGYSISRKTGMPFGLIDNANPGLDWNALSIGQEINLPTPDELLPETPVPTKRIVVDLDKLWLVAYENEQIKYSYPISIGRTEAPTFPGVFQVLTHNDVAYGSSFTLCTEGTSDCGQWEMQWFMGIYNVVPGLMNGLHGDVLLPNGYLLGGGGGAQGATTFGCVMADNNNAKALYDWAETGTMVEILSSDFAPRSDLGQQAYDLIRNNPPILAG